MASGNNIVKVRDDYEPIEFCKCEDFDGDKIFRVVSGQLPDWAPTGDFTITDLRSRIEPWLTSLFQSEHLSLLVGSGLTTAIQYAACSGGSNGMESFEPKSHYADRIKIKATESAKATGRGENPNIEDYIRVMNELLRGLEVLG